MEEEAAKRDIDLLHVYMNCKLEGTRKILLYRNMLEKVSPNIATRSLSSEEMLHQMMKHLNESDKYLLITIDEFGYLLKRAEEPVVYDLTRLNEIFPREPCRVLGTIFISRDTSHYQYLDESELSTLGRYYIEFERYNSNQIRDILSLRVEEAFQKGAIDNEIIDFISDVVSREPINGDLRVALDLLLYAGIYAENEGYSCVKPEHVRFVLRQTHPYITTDEILSLSDNGRLVLLALVRALEAGKRPYANLREIREFYNVVCEEQNVSPILEIEEEVQDLIDHGIVMMKSLTHFGISGVTTKDLDQFLTGLRQRIYDGINGF